VTNKYDVMGRLGRVCEYEFRGDGPRLTRENPAVITLGEEFASFGDTLWLLRKPEITAWIYERVTTAEVLRIDMRIPEVQARNFQTLKRKLGSDYRKMPYGQVHVSQNASDTATITVTHSLHAADVSTGGLREVFLGMVWAMEQVLHDADTINDIVRGSDDESNSRETSESDSPESSEEEGELDNSDIPSKLRCPDDIIVRADGLVAADEDPLHELQSLIGLGDVKRLVGQLAAQARVAQRRRDAGFNAVALSPHLVFTGNPGTGKTTVARLIGKLYKQLGLLSSGHLVEADRSTLVAPYIGQTALKTLDVCRKALDGILFVDEAYTLAAGHHIDFGYEAIATLLTFMENNRGRFALVVAGYENRMQTFLDANPGLRSRFDVAVPFPDYSTDELTEIFAGLVKQYEYEITPDAMTAVGELIARMPRGEAFGNARDIRRVFNNIVANHAVLLGESGLGDSRRLNSLGVNAVPCVSTVSEGGSLIGRTFAGYL
jgi:SpoVK/Ycf46/Vps4 family AAA+-type ATPase